MRSPAVHRAGANLQRHLASLTVFVLPATVSAQTTFDVIGESRAVNNSLNLKYVYAW